jgi:hypothetical protein
LYYFASSHLCSHFVGHDVFLFCAMLIFFDLFIYFTNKALLCLFYFVYVFAVWIFIIWNFDLFIYMKLWFFIYFVVCFCYDVFLLYDLFFIIWSFVYVFAVSLNKALIYLFILPIFYFVVCLKSILEKL